MDAASILRELASRGVLIQPNGDRLRLESGQKIADGLLAEVRAHKAELLLLLRPSGPVETAPAVGAVSARVLTFRRLLPALGPAPRLRVPGAPYGKDLCINCGEVLPPADEASRFLELSCPTCQEAQTEALREGPITREKSND